MQALTDLGQAIGEFRQVLGCASSDTYLDISHSIRDIRHCVDDLRSALDFRSAVSGFELKFSSSGPGSFSGLGAVFGNVDSHGDIIMPGAFAASLADHAAKATMPGMYAEHSQYVAGGDPLPVGVWTSIREDSRGLRCEGKISGLDNDFGARLWGLITDGALPGLSIAFFVPSGGATSVQPKKAGDASRILRRINLVSIDIVRSPSNPAALIDQSSFLRSQRVPARGMGR